MVRASHLLSLSAFLLCATALSLPHSTNSRESEDAGTLHGELVSNAILAASSWTTVQPNGLPLNRATLNIRSGASPNITSAPDGKASILGFFPKGSYIPSQQPRGGFTFYALGPASVDLTTAKEATFEYSVFFEEGFDFVKGGKLPGLYGGETDELALHCSGGRDSPDCWSARLMWRSNGDGEIYLYLPMARLGEEFAENEKICSLPKSRCNPDYGNSISRGAFRFSAGEWTKVTERVRLNDVGQYSAEIELSINGESVIQLNGIKLGGELGRIRGMQWETFFGGSTVDWASPKNQSAWFTDITVTINELL